MISHWIQAGFATFITSEILQFFSIKFAHRFQLMDIPSARRRHLLPTPVIGGVGILIGWICGLGFFCFGQSEPFPNAYLSLSILISGALTLMVLGLIDDLQGLSPFWKLLVEGITAALTLAYEPQIHTLCLHWSKSIGPFVWVLGILWIVGIINCLNLVDGLDGLAGGTSLLILGSISLLCRISAGMDLELPLLVTLPLMATLLPFLRKNWNQAKIFLGDNGSLPLGYLIATTSLLCHPKHRSWIMVASIVLMLGYPILDTGLAVLRRYRKQQPLFKADRNHLHYRIQRLGLNVRQTATLLLSITLLLQLTSIGINFIPPRYAIIVIGAVMVSLFSLFLLIYSIEASKVDRLLGSLNVKPIRLRSLRTSAPKGETSIHIEIDTLMEAGMMEEQNRYKDLFISLKLLLEPYGSLDFQNREIVIYFSRKLEPAEILAITQTIRSKIASFLELFELQCSLASIPITVKKGSRLKKVS